MAQETVAGFDESRQLDVSDVALLDVDGDTKEVVILAVVEHAGVDYALLAAPEALEEGDAEVDLAIARYGVDPEGKATLQPVTDADVSQEVWRVCSALIPD